MSEAILAAINEIKQRATGATKSKQKKRNVSRKRLRSARYKTAGLAGNHVGAYLIFTILNTQEPCGNSDDAGACNCVYVSLNCIMDLWKWVIAFFQYTWNSVWIKNI